MENGASHQKNDYVFFFFFAKTATFRPFRKPNDRLSFKFDIKGI